MASFKQSSVRCPFYRDDDGKGRIVCEGLLDVATEESVSRIALEYEQKQDFDIQIGEFCSKRYTNCEIYRILIEKEEEP